MQPESSKLFSEHSLGPVSAKLYQSDARNFLKSLRPASVDLIVTSPPYFIGKEYDTSKSARDFSKEVRAVAPEMIRVLKPGGSICWQVGNHIENGALTPLDALVVAALFRLQSITLRNRLIWTFEHGAHAKQRFSGRHETILWYSKGNKPYFDLDAVRVPQKYPGKRHYKGPNKGEWSGNPLGKNPGDVWDVGALWNIPNVKANHTEKTGHPCQFPTALVRRLVTALSPIGGLVIDPYAGSATTAVSCILDGRNFAGCDIDLRYLAIGNERLSSLVSGSLRVRPDLPVHIPKGNEKVATRPPHFAYSQVDIGASND